MLFLFVAVFIMVLSVGNLKKGLIAYLAYQIFWLESGALFSIGGKSFTYGMTMNLFFLALYFLKNYHSKTTKVNFPFALPFLLTGISYIFTCFVAVAGFSSEFTRAISNIIHEIPIIWLIWKLLETERDFYELFKWITILMFAACLYGIIEYITELNPLYMRKSQLLFDEVIVLYANARDRGYRVCSFFEHPIGAGMMFALYFVTTFFLYVNNKKIPYRKFAIFTALLCVPCALLTKMRSALLFMLMGSFSFVNLRKKRFLKILLFGVLAGFLVLPLLGEYISIFISLFDINQLTNYSSSGSSLAQRLDQFEAVYQLMKSSAIGGLGELFQDYVKNQYTAAALSYESVWLEQMARHGLLGVIAKATLMIWMIVLIPKKYKSREIGIIALAYWITYTLTSIPAFRMPLYYVLIIYLIKQTLAYQSQKEFCNMESGKLTGRTMFVVGRYRFTV